MPSIAEWRMLTFSSSFSSSSSSSSSSVSSLALSCPIYEREVKLKTKRMMASIVEWWMLTCSSSSSPSDSELSIALFFRVSDRSTATIVLRHYHSSIIERKVRKEEDNAEYSIAINANLIRFIAHLTSAFLQSCWSVGRKRHPCYDEIVSDG